MSILLKRPKSSKPLKPVSGSARVLRPIGDVNPTSGEIAINGKPYFIQVFSCGYRLFGWDGKNGAVTVYDIPADCSGCDCADAVYRDERPEGCKHRKAVAALVAAGKIPAVSGLGARHEQETPF